MKSEDYLICCDWGTSNFRLYLVEKATLTIVADLKKADGVAALNDAWKNTDTKQPRSDFFRDYLTQCIHELALKSKKELKEVSVVLSGMSSASIGMVEVAYAELPFDLNNPNLNCEQFSDTTTHSNKIYVFGGLRSENDVMRGEEIELLGLRDQLPSSCLCILPGTHSKHIKVDKGAVSSFETFMTGEVFSLMKQHSILKNSLQNAGQMNDADFMRGVKAASENKLLNTMFHVRTNDLLHGLDSTSNEAYLSGLLIGTELQKAAAFEGDIVLGGNTIFSALYKRALETIKPNVKLQLIAPEDMAHAIPKAHLYLVENVN